MPTRRVKLLLAYINGSTTTFAVLHLVTLARWRPLIVAIRTQTDSHVITDSHVGNKGSWAFAGNCSGIQKTGHVCVMHMIICFERFSILTIRMISLNVSIIVNIQALMFYMNCRKKIILKRNHSKLLSLKLDQKLIV